MDLSSLTKKQKISLAIIGTVVGILLWAFITAGIITHDFNRQQLENSNGDNQQADVKGIILTETKNEQKFWEIYGRTGHWDSSNGIAQLNDVTANFYKNNEVIMSLESSKGTYDSVHGDIKLFKDTHVALKDGIILYADSVHWIDSSTPIVGEGHIMIKKDKSLYSKADKIIISPDYDKFKIIGHTVSKIYEDK